MVENEWATPTLKEVPFWRDGMSVEEYEIEREYYYRHMNDVRNGIYQPLWKQNQCYHKVLDELDV